MSADEEDDHEAQEILSADQEDDDVKEEQDNMEKIRQILDRRNESLVDLLQQTTRQSKNRASYLIEGVRDKVLIALERIEEVKNETTQKLKEEMTKHREDVNTSIQMLTDQLDEQMKRERENMYKKIDTIMKETNQTKAKLQRIREKMHEDEKKNLRRSKKTKKELRELKQQLFGPEIENSSNTKPADYKALRYWMKKYGRFSDELRKKLIQNQITSFDLLKKVSFEYMVQLNVVPLDEIPKITDVISSITSGDIAKCMKESQSLQCRDKIVEKAADKRTDTTNTKHTKCTPFKPRYNCVQLTNDRIPKSRGAQKLYDATPEITNAGGMDFDDEYHEPSDIRLDFGDASDRKLYKDAITRFLVANKESDEDKTRIHIDEDKILINMGPKQGLSPSKGTRANTKIQSNYYRLKKMCDVLTVKTCKESHAEALISKKGVFAKQQIPEHCVLGEYYGIEYIEKEFEDIYQNTMEKSEHERYSIKKKKKLAISIDFMQDLFENKCEEEKQSEDHRHNHNKKRSYAEMNEDKVNNGGTPHKKRKLHKCKGVKIKLMKGDYEEKKMYEKTFVLVVDPLGLHKKRDIWSMLWDINDCRAHLYVDGHKGEDEQRRNIKCVNCFVNNWPRIFIVSDKTIKKGQELLSYCGSGYEDNVYAQQRDQKMRTMFQ